MDLADLDQGPDRDEGLDVDRVSLDRDLVAHQERQMTSCETASAELELEPVVGARPRTRSIATES